MAFGLKLLNLGLPKVLDFLGKFPVYMENCLLHAQVAEFQPPDTVKNYFTNAF